MNKNIILETTYETIKESVEWALDSEDKVFGNYIDGVITLTSNLLEKEVNKTSQE